MKTLLVAATLPEIEPFLKIEHSLKPDILITGVGMVNTTFRLTQQLEKNQYQLVVNAGIAGCFDRNIEIGSVCVVEEDIFSEIGYEEDENFVSFQQSNFFQPNEIITKPFIAADIERKLQLLPKVSAITVNTVHGNQQSIQKLQKSYSPTLESMEGAAVFYVCANYQTPCLQLRSISNYVEKRNVKQWNIPLAIKNLNTELLNFFYNG